MFIYKPIEGLKSAILLYFQGLFYFIMNDDIFSSIKLGNLFQYISICLRSLSVRQILVFCFRLFSNAQVLMVWRLLSTISNFQSFRILRSIILCTSFYQKNRLNALLFAFVSFMLVTIIDILHVVHKLTSVFCSLYCGLYRSRLLFGFINLTIFFKK